MHDTRLTFLFAILLLTCLARSAPVQAADEEGVALFDGKTLSGWKVAEHPESIRAENGMIVCDGARAHAYYEGPFQNHDFKNFDLTAEAKLAPGASSGIYFHTAYQKAGFPSKGHEYQINNTHRTPKRTGSLYEVVNLHDTTVKDDEWIKIRILVVDKRIQLFVNGERTVDYTEPADYVPSPERPGRSIGSGTIALQCTDPTSKAWFRNIRIRSLP